MTRTYELVLIADPRLSDEDAVALVDDYKSMLESEESTKVVREESWGKRKFAYPIQKFNEGRYHVYFLEAEAENTLPTVEQRMRQNDKVLRHLVVRTDLDLKRAASKGKAPLEEEAEEAVAAEAEA